MDKIKVYLDNCCFNRPYDDQQSILIRLEAEAKLFVQSKIKEGDIDLIWSYILSYENSKNNDIMKQSTIEKWRFLSLETIDPSEQIDKIAEEMLSIGIKEIDAIHLACAIFEACNYFLTTDKGILKKKSLIKNINIVNPVDFVEIYMEVQNDDR